MGSLDRKCTEECWYCEGNCHHCLQPANIGYSLRTIGGNTLKFCKNNLCYSFYTQSSTIAPDITMPLPFPTTNSELLLQVTKVISTDWSENTVMIIQICIASSLQNINGLNVGQLYALTQFRTLNYQACFDFSISDEFVPLSALQYMQHKNAVIMHHSALLELMLKLVVEDALNKTSYKTLERLIDSHESAKQNQHSQVQTEDVHDETLELTEGMCLV